MKLHQNIYFNILKWRKEKLIKFQYYWELQNIYIIAILTSTIAPESTFSAGRRMLDEKRSRLAPHIIQIYVCKKDWDQVDVRIQGLKNDNNQDNNDPWMTMDKSIISGGKAS